MEAPNRRVLHVHGRDGTRIQADGPALRIEQCERAPVWMPLDRIGILVIQGAVDINSQTIASVLESGAAVRLLATDGTVLGDLEPCGPEVSRAADWRPMYERWLLTRSLLQAVAHFGARVLRQELGRSLGPGTMLLKAIAPGLADTRNLRQNATRWLNRAVELIEDAQGTASPRAQDPSPTAQTPLPSPHQHDPDPTRPRPRAPHLQRWIEQQDRDHE